MAKKGDWVRIHAIVLKPDERAKASLPADTQQVPLELWTKGYLEEDASLGDEVTIVTRTGRTLTGTLCDEAPHYSHSFGAFVPELQLAGDEAFRFLFGGEEK